MVALLCAYVVIAMPFLGISWKQTQYWGVMLMLSGSILLLVESRRRIAERSPSSGFGHLGTVALVMMILWGQPWWPIPRPQQPDDFEVFVWPFLVLVSATRILSAQPPRREDEAPEGEPGLA